jgi:hypothetical protein
MKAKVGGLRLSLPIFHFGKFSKELNEITYWGIIKFVLFI